MCAVALRSSGPIPVSRHAARKVPMPDYIEPCDPTLRDRPAAGEDWFYEIKADGYRAQVHLEDGEITVYSRAGYDWTGPFSTIADAARSLKARHAIIDGEAVVYGANGVPD